MRKTGKSSLFLLLLSLGFASYCSAEENVFTWADGGLQYSNNVYRDSRAFADAGYTLSAGAGLKGKLAKFTPYKLVYNLDISGYFTQNVQNEIFNGASLYLGRLLGQNFELELLGNASYSYLPFADVYSYLNYYGKPSLTWYVFDHTSIKGGYIYGGQSYPLYNLSNNSTGYSFSLMQELSIYTSVKASYSGRTADYLNKNLYSGVVAGVPAFSIELRKDTESLVGVSLLHEFSLDMSVELSGSRVNFESNDNFIEWGPLQSETVNTVVGDERIIQNYRSFVSYNAACKIKFVFDDSSAEISTAYASTEYAGRLAKNSLDVIISPEEIRKDTQWILSALWSLPLSKQTTLKITGIYEANDSNDALYKYTAITGKAAVVFYF